MMSSNPTDRAPVLPKEINPRSSALALAGCLYALALWWLPCLAVAALWHSSAPLTVKVLFALPLGWMSGYGILLTGLMGHDATHFNLHGNKVVSSVMGILITAPTVAYFLMGFTISHWNHHRYTNTELDPDSQIFAPFRNFLSRALFARPYAFYVYGAHTWRLALGTPLPFAYSFPLPAATLRRLAWLNLACNLAMAGAYVWLLTRSPIMFSAAIFALACGSIVSGLNPYIEHDGTDFGRGRDTRTSVGAWWDVFLLGNNYHLEHHLYPTVPFYNLKNAYRFLQGAGFYEGPRHLSRGFWDTYRYTMGKYPYPQSNCRETRQPALQGGFPES